MSSESNNEQRERIKESVLQAIANRLVDNLQDKLFQEDKIFTGKARDSIRYYKDIKTVGSENDHIRNIEYGRMAGSHVPIKPLQEYAEKKLGIPSNQSYGVAKAIEKKIFEKGIPMTRFAKNTLMEMLYR